MHETEGCNNQYRHPKCPRRGGWCVCKICRSKARCRGGTVPVIAAKRCAAFIKGLFACVQRPIYHQDRECVEYVCIVCALHDVCCCGVDVGICFMQSGDMAVVNHTTQDMCTMMFHEFSYFSKSPPRRVSHMLHYGHAVLHKCLAVAYGCVHVCVRVCACVFIWWGGGGGGGGSGMSKT